MNVDIDKDIICSCSGTTKAQIQALILDGVVDLERISRITGALSGCGGCEFDLQTLVHKHQMSALEN